MHCARLSNEGFLYVASETDNRIQVFSNRGEFLKGDGFKLWLMDLGARYEDL